MILTQLQKTLLSRHHEIAFRKKRSGGRGYFIGTEDCTSTVNSLIVKGLLATDGIDGRLRPTSLLKLASGIPESSRDIAS